MGITGCNFAVAETGSIVLVENEGNGRFSTTVPRIHVAVMGMERIVERWDQLDLLLLLGFPNNDSEFLDALAELCARWPRARLVAIAEGRADQLIAALKAGVHGYLARYISAEALLRFLRLIVLGQRVFSTRSLDLTKHLGQDTTRTHASPGARASGLSSNTFTERERELLAFLVEGESNKVIARRLGVAEATIKAQMVKLFVKVGAANRTQAVVLAWTLHRASPLRTPKAPDERALDRVS